MEKLEPKKERSPISSLKFQRKSDYKKFRNFIKKETKELEGIVEPKQDKLKNILNVGAVGLGLFAIGGIFAAKGKDDDGTSGKFKTPFIVGRRNPSDLPDLPKMSVPKRIPQPFVEKSAGQRVKIPKRVIKKRYAAVKNKVTVGGGGGDSRSVTPPPKKKFGLSGPKDFEKQTGQIQAPKTKVEFIGDDVFFDTGKGKVKLDVITIKGREYYFFDARVSSFLRDKQADKIREQILFDDRFTVDDATGKIKFNPSATISKPNIFKKFMNFYNKGRTPAEDTMKFFGKDGLIADDFSKITRTDKAFKEGAKGLKGARPFKAFTPNMLKTGPTPLTRQLIERPFKFLKNSPVVSSILKSKVTKTGFFVIDLIFAGQAFADLFKPKDNLRTSVVDLYNAINNQVYKNDPSKLKYYITESSDERIRAYHMQKNKEIRLLKEQAGVNLGGPQNILVIPENKQNNEVITNIPIKKGEDKISFVPFEPLNSVGTDILLHKLNQ